MYLLDVGPNKLTTGRENSIEGLDKNKNLQLAEVVSVYDPNSLGRIKVRIKGPRALGGDDGVTDANLPWCFPLLPKHLSVQPKPKEAVFIFTFDVYHEHADRLYIGPIISQSQYLNQDPFYVSALAGFTFGAKAPDVSINTIPQLNGVFPDPQDVSIQGRYNTDITQKTNEIVIRAGKFEKSTPDNNNPYPFTFNATTQAYIQIKNEVTISPATDEEEAQIGSVTNVVANKINLLTHKDSSPRFELLNQDNLISDEELAKILSEAHQLPFGDILLQYLIAFKNAFFSHVHNGNGNAATDLVTSGNKQPLQEFKKIADDLEKAMLSKNIRIN